MTTAMREIPRDAAVQRLPLAPPEAPRRAGGGVVDVVAIAATSSLAGYVCMVPVNAAPGVLTLMKHAAENGQPVLAIGWAALHATGTLGALGLGWVSSSLADKVVYSMPKRARASGFGVKCLALVLGPTATLVDYLLPGMTGAALTFELGLLVWAGRRAAGAT